MHRRVNILQYVKTPSGQWQWAAIPKNSRTGKYLWSKATSDRFYIVWREAKKRRYQKAGTTPSEVLEAKRRKEFELAGRAVLESGRRIPKHDELGFTIADAVSDFLEFVKNKKRPNTLKRYRAALLHFQNFFGPGMLVTAVTPADLDAFRDERMGEKNNRGGPISAANVNSEVNTIRAFYYYLKKFRDPELSNPAAGLKPLAVTQKLVDVYEERDLELFFDACTLEERAIFKTFSYTGLREQELAHLHWSDLNLHKGMLAVHAKPDEGFIPKDWESGKFLCILSWFLC